MSVSGPNIERNPGDNDLDYSLAIEPLVDLAIENAHFERLVVGRTTLLQLAVENLGPNEPASKVTLRNDLPAGLEYTEAVGDDRVSDSSARTGRRSSSVSPFRWWRSACGCCRPTPTGKRT
jgi:hypothetical protein